MWMMTFHFYLITYKAVLSPGHFFKEKEIVPKSLMTFAREEIQTSFSFKVVRVLYHKCNTAVVFASVSYCFLWTIKPQAVEIIWYNNGVKSTCSSDPVCF